MYVSGRHFCKSTKGGKGPGPNRDREKGGRRTGTVRNGEKGEGTTGPLNKYEKRGNTGGFTGTTGASARVVGFFYI